MGKMSLHARRESGYSDAKEQSFPACAGKGMKTAHPSIPGVLRKWAKSAQRSAARFAVFLGNPRKRFLDFLQMRSARAQQRGRGLVCAGGRHRDEGARARSEVGGGRAARGRVA
jgi:hypothetical protein